MSGAPQPASNCMHNGIRLSLKAGNGCYFAPSHLFWSQLLANIVKENLCTTYLRPVMPYVCITWATTVGDKKRLNNFLKEVLRKMYGPVYYPDTKV